MTKSTSKKDIEVLRKRTLLSVFQRIGDTDRVLPFFEEQQIPVLRVLTDRGTEFCGALEKHPYELYLELNDIEHAKPKAKSPQTNGICERVHQTILNEFYRVAFRKKIYPDLEALQVYE